MRKLKFRAWDKKRRSMVYSIPEVNPQNCRKLIYCDMETIAIGLDGCLYLIDECGNYEYPIDVGEEYEIMQFTNLHDKNGREIYEGDILGGVYEGCYIGWCDECKQIQLITPVYGCMACLGDVYWYELVEQNGKLEVIGNIWENPELLPQ